MMADERQVTGPVSEDLFDDGDMDAMFGDSDPGAVSRVLAFREAGGENDDGAPAPGAPASLAERGRSNSISSLDGITVKTSDNVDLVKAFEFIVTSIVHAGQGRDAALNFTGNKRYGSKQDTNFDVTKFDGLADAGRELHMRSIIESARNGHLAELVGVGKLLRDFWLFVVCGKSVKALGYLGLERNSKQIISKNGRKNAVASFLMQLYNDVGRLYGVKASMSVTEVMKAGMRGRNTAAKKIALTFFI